MCLFVQGYRGFWDRLLDHGCGAAGRDRGYFARERRYGPAKTMVGAKDCSADLRSAPALIVTDIPNFAYL